MKTVTGRIWTYVRDDRPFGGEDPPAAFFEYSRSCAGEYPQKHLAGFTGILQLTRLLVMLHSMMRGGSLLR